MTLHTRKQLFTFGVLALTLIALLGMAAPRPASADPTGTLQVLNGSCSGVTVQFYYDGVTSDHALTYTAPVGERFRLRVENQSCQGPGGTGQPCTYQVYNSLSAVPDIWGNITLTAQWPQVPLGNGLLVTVEQINTIKGVQVGAPITAFYTCSSPAPCLSCQTVPVGSPAPCPNCASAGSSVYAPFLFTCLSDGVQVSAGGIEVLRASFGQIYGPLTTATSIGQNQFITRNGDVALYALRSNELQVQRDSAAASSRVVVPATICGAVTPSTHGPQPSSGWTTPSYAGGTYHVVQYGENLFRISLRYGVSMDAIAAANGITNYALIYAGQRLYIP